MSATRDFDLSEDVTARRRLRSRGVMYYCYFSHGSQSSPVAPNQGMPTRQVRVNG